MRLIPSTPAGCALRLSLGLALFFAAGTAAHAQYSAGSTGIPPQSQPQQTPGILGKTPSTEPADPTLDPTMEARRARAANDERHKKLLADTAKLLELAQALRDEVEKSGKDELNVDVVKKATEMEKLSHDIKDRMRY